MVKINNCKLIYFCARDFLEYLIYQFLFCFLVYKRFYVFVKKMVTNYRKLSKKSIEEMFIDVLFDSTEDEQVIYGDVCLYIVVGFYIIGNCELNCFYVLFVYVILFVIILVQNIVNNVNLF